MNEPFYSDQWLTILGGDCREVMAQMEPESVQCVVTSPPYLGLRDYGIEPSVWGGDLTCTHEWRTKTLATEIGKGNWSQGTNGRGELQPGGVDAAREPIRSTATVGSCVFGCGAWLGVLGLEPTIELYVAHVVEVFRGVRRVLRRDGVVWCNLGDAYSNKQRQMVPARVALALQADGWWLRDEIVWAKPNPMPSSVTDRTTPAHEMVYLLTKSARYFYDAEAIKEPAINEGRIVSYDGSQKNTGHENSTYPGSTGPRDIIVSGRNKRSVWTIPTAPYPDAHFATFPPKLIEPMILAGTSERGCCPECGAPWKRETSIEYNGKPTYSTWAKEHAGGLGKYEDGHKPQDGRGMGSGPPRYYREMWGGQLPPRATGWRPSCGHSLVGFDPACSVPCVVLDPFAGSGTVGVVASAHGRRTILIDMNPDYLKQSLDRNLKARPAQVRQTSLDDFLR